MQEAKKKKKSAYTIALLKKGTKYVYGPYLYPIFQFCILYYIFLNLVPFCFKLFLIGPKSLLD